MIINRFNEENKNFEVLKQVPGYSIQQYWKSAKAIKFFGITRLELEESYFTANKINFIEIVKSELGELYFSDKMVLVANNFLDANTLNISWISFAKTFETGNKIALSQEINVYYIFRKSIEENIKESDHSKPKAYYTTLGCDKENNVFIIILNSLARKLNFGKPVTIEWHGNSVENEDLINLMDDHGIGIRIP